MRNLHDFIESSTIFQAEANCTPGTTKLRLLPFSISDRVLQLVSVEQHAGTELDTEVLRHGVLQVA